MTLVLAFEMETSAPPLALAFGAGFWAYSTLEIIQERLEREFDLDLITTAPSVVYTLKLKDGTDETLHNPADMPDVMKIEEIHEPWINRHHPKPLTNIWAELSNFAKIRRGVQKELTYVGNRAMIVYELPLNEVVFDFYDRLKSISKGYASFDYQPIGVREGDLG